MMSPRRRVFLLSFVLELALVSPTASLGAAKGTDRPLNGTRTGTTTLNLVTGTATSDLSGQLSHLGRFTGTADLTFIPTPLPSFAFGGPATLVAANGDELFETVTGSGAFTSATTSESTVVVTITGGTGRFADASGTYTDTVSSVTISQTPTTTTTQDTATEHGQISY